MKKRSAAGLAITAALLASPLLPTPGYAAGVNFKDIEKSYAKDAILQLAEKGIVVGLPSGEFNPTGAFTRQDFTIILVRALDLNVEEIPAKASFSDVSRDNYAYRYVEAAAKAKLIYGTGDGKFAGDAILSRQDMATMFVRALGVDATGYAKNLTFSDAATISDYAKDAVGFTLDAGLVKGIGNNTFNPKGTASRQDVALVASKFLVVQEELAKPAPVPTPVPDPTPEVDQPPVVSPEPLPDPTPVPVMIPPDTDFVTSSIGSLPHFRHVANVNYSSAITKVTLQKDGGALSTYTVETSDVQLFNNSDIVVFGLGTYTSPGHYVWTIEATGYMNKTVEVTIPPLELTLVVSNPAADSSTINLPSTFNGQTITWMIVEGSGSIYTPYVYTTQTRQTYDQTSTLEATFQDGSKKYFKVIVPVSGDITVTPNPDYTPPTFELVF